MRLILYVSIMLGLFLLTMNTPSLAVEKKISVILEIEGSPQQAKKQIKANYPLLEVVAEYQTLFHGIAIKGKLKNIEKIAREDFVQAMYPVQSYEMNELDTSSLDDVDEHAVIPSETNATPYTGKGVKVGVIDTGIALDHPDLKNNIKEGYDLVDLDDEPAETTEEEGEPTFHGTHVAGIIAANGNLKGVAPDSELYIYRALGPGGQGTSIQVIAAMEEAVKAGVDVMNLSLGNTINEPDYPTSKAVNEAVKQGTAVIVANGNDGPENWTVGAPATSRSAFSVGALQSQSQQLVMKEPHSKREIPLNELSTGYKWEVSRDDLVTQQVHEARGKVGLVSLSSKTAVENLKRFEQAGAKGVLIDVEKADPSWLELIQSNPPDIPIAMISHQDARFIQGKLDKKSPYFTYEFIDQQATTAPFSSNGPVTVNWMMKPDLIAPGVNILSTVPDGYDVLNGTSMATPYVTGAYAVLKEAHPTWSNAQIFGALRTTAKTLKDAKPIAQGAGAMQLDKAIDTDIIIEHSLLSFGKMGEHINEKTIALSIENMSNKQKTLHFEYPKRQNGLTWDLPHEIHLQAKESKEVPIRLKADTMKVNKDMLEGWLDLNTGDETFSLAYTAILNGATYPRVVDFELTPSPNESGDYNYSLYATEQVKSVELKVYNPDTLQYEGMIGKWDDLQVGENEGEIPKSKIKEKGHYLGLLLVLDEASNYHSYETNIMID